tara:strand:+ start:628 stop:807 length:180 start_codon:yes stop_codon:yes gene_type:complete
MQDQAQLGQRLLEGKNIPFSVKKGEKNKLEHYKREVEEEEYENGNGKEEDHDNNDEEFI